MRAIDADHLRRWILSRVFKTQLSVADVIDQIDREDTIEPQRKTGKWITSSEFEDCYYAKCNQCNIKQVFYFNKPLTNFCPNCGADMRG